MEHLSKLVQEIERKNGQPQDPISVSPTINGNIVKSKLENKFENQENQNPVTESGQENILFDDFEEISYQIKHAFNEKKNIRCRDLASRKNTQKLDHFLKNLIAKCGKGLLGSRMRKKGGSLSSRFKSKISIQRKNNFSNYQSLQTTLLKKVGLGFSEQERSFLNHDVNILIRKHGVDLSIFGKVLGTQSNYYVLYGLLNPAKKEGVLERVQRIRPEPVGYGLNRFLVLAGSLSKTGCSQKRNTMMDWKLLPPVSGEMMRGAMFAKRLLKGDLQQHVKHLVFEGSEAQLLKCQVIRMLVDCHLAPKGIFEYSEENQQIERNKEELELPKDEEARNLENFVKMHKSILKSGRMERFVPKSVAEDDRQEFIDKETEEDPQNPPLAQIEQPQLAEWKTRVFGDKTKINDAAGENPTDHRTVLISHRHWKGGHNVYHPGTGQYAFFYCGYGVNFNQTVFPLNFYSINLEEAEKGELPEPNGKVEEPEIEETGEGDQEGEETGEDIEAATGEDNQDVPEQD